MKNIKLFNYNINPCLVGLFGRYLGSKSFTIFFLIGFFSALFLIGNPYISLSIMFICFTFLCLNFFRIIQTDLSFLNIIVLTSMVYFLYSNCGKLIILFFLLLIEFSIFLLILSFLSSFFFSKMVKFTKIFFISFLVSILSLSLFLALAKLYFFNAAVSLISSNAENYPLLSSEIPSNVYLSIKNYDFLNIQKNALFVLDFSSDPINPVGVQLVHFSQNEHLFYYMSQLLYLDIKFPFHLILVFT